MNLYRVVRIADGVEVYRYSADAPIEWAGMEFAAYSHELVDVPAPPEPPPPPPVRISRLAFLSRFTDAEAIRVDLASIGATVQAAGMRRYMQKVNAAEFIDLNRSDTRGGVIALEAAGLLDAPGRALVILDTPPAAQEVWNG